MSQIGSGNGKIDTIGQSVGSKKKGSLKSRKEEESVAGSKNGSKKNRSEQIVEDDQPKHSDLGRSEHREKRSHKESKKSGKGENVTEKSKRSRKDDLDPEAFMQGDFSNIEFNKSKSTSLAPSSSVLSFEKTLIHEVS